MRSPDDLLPARPRRVVVGRRSIENLAIAIVPSVIGGVSGLATIDGVRGWYRTLDRPQWNPPDRVFGPVWTALYASMGVSLVRIVRSRGAAKSPLKALAMGLFAVQLVLNGAWSWIFFRRHALGAALAEILVLWLAIVATIGTTARLRPSAAALLVPYLAWVSFATLLTAEIWRRNRGHPDRSAR